MLANAFLMSIYKYIDLNEILVEATLEENKTYKKYHH